MILAITGGTGTLGKELVKRFSPDFDKVYVISRDELKQHEMESVVPGNVRFFLADVRDYFRLTQVFDGVSHVVHAAALKQVPRCEYNPTEAIRTNVEGSKNVVDAAILCGVKRCVLVSTDKAVNPVNLYGASKLCAEKLFMAANKYNKTSFGVVRYGNVIGSRGSIVEVVEKCRELNESVPLTHQDMTRFWITKEEAVELIERSLNLWKIHHPFIPVARSCKVGDFIRELWPEVQFKIIGIRPGEKLHEMLAAYGEEVYLPKTGIFKKGPICSAPTE